MGADWIRTFCCTALFAQLKNAGEKGNGVQYPQRKTAETTSTLKESREGKPSDSHHLRPCTQGARDTTRDVIGNISGGPRSPSNVNPKSHTVILVTPSNNLLSKSP